MNKKMEGRRRQVVGVMGSGTDEHQDLAQPLGQWLAQEGYHLLTGGGKGVMSAVSKAFTSTQPRQGLCMGVVPGNRDGQGVPRPPSGYPNEFVELVIQTHLPLSGQSGQADLSRNHINILSSDVVVALPGAAGTQSELAVKYGKPVVFYAGEEGRVTTLTPPEGVAIVHTLEEVQDFVKKHGRN